MKLKATKMWRDFFMGEELWIGRLEDCKIEKLKNWKIVKLEN
jgi:hypothetical protein